MPYALNSLHSPTGHVGHTLLALMLSRQADMLTSERQERHMTRPLYCHGQGTLMFGTQPRLTTRPYLPSFTDITTQDIYLLIVDVRDMVHAKGTYPPPPPEATARTATATLSALQPSPPLRRLWFFPTFLNTFRTFFCFGQRHPPQCIRRTRRFLSRVSLRSPHT